MVRELLTIVFTDIVGSTEMRSRAGDDDADRIVAAHDAAADELVSAHRGRVIKFLGDGALAVFTSAVDAVEAASALLTRLADSGPTIRVGIHAGDVDAAAGDVSGLPVAIASRLCGLAEPGTIVASGLVRSLIGVRSDLGFESRGWQTLKGVTDPVEAWVVTTDGAVTDHPLDELPRVMIGRPADVFVGRSDAMAALDESYERLDRQYLVAVSGEPGIGKTTLVAHWAQRVQSEGATVSVGSSPPEVAAPYQPFIEAVRPLIQTDPSLKPNGPGAANLARLIPELAGATTGPPVLDDPQTERFLINEAFVEVFRRVVERRAPLVTVLDDLHWADEASIVLLGHILRHPQNLPVLFVGTYRDTDLGRRHPLADLLRDQRLARRADRLDLVGLEVGEVATLVASVAGGVAPDGALDVIMKETEGNPFFITEVIEHLMAEAVVVDGAWDFDPAAAMTIPEGIRDTIGRRLDRLSEGAQTLLAAAAVIGASFEVDVLAAVVGGPLTEVEASLEEALSAGFLVERQGREVGFSHALVRQTIGEEISVLRRSRLHRSAGEALEIAGAPPDRLVQHWIEAREYPKALHAAMGAMREAQTVAAASAVIAHAGAVLDLWSEVDAADRDGLERHEAVVAAGSAIAVSRSWHDGVEYLRSHRRQLEADGDTDGVGVILTEEARHLWPLGRVHEALEAAEMAIELIPPEPPTSERAAAEAQVARLLMLAGRDPVRATAAARRALGTARAAADPLSETATLATLGTLLPDPVEAEATLRKALEMATAHNAYFQVTRARTNLSELLSSQGQHDESIAVMREGVEIARELGLEASLEWMVANLAERYRAGGHWSQALETLDLSIAPSYAKALQLMLRAQIITLRGQTDEAAALLEDLATDYSSVTDIQFLVPLATVRLWLARVTGDLGSLREDVFRQELGSDWSAASWSAVRYLLAAAEIAAWAEQIGKRVVESERLDEWATTAEQIPASRHGEAIRSTLRAQRLRYDGTYDEEAWREAVDAWSPGTFAHLATVLAWTGAAPGRGEAIEEPLRSALETAERLGAQPMTEELRRFATR